MWCPMFLGICKFLQQIDQELVKDGSPSYTINTEKPTIHMEF